MRKPKTFRENIRFLFIAYALVPLVLLMVLFLVFFVFSTQYSLQQKTSRSNGLVTAALATEMQAYQEFVGSFGQQPSVLAFYGNSSEKSAVYQQFYHFNNQRSIKSSLHLVNGQGQFLLSSRQLGKEAEDFFARFIFARIQRSAQPIFYEANTLTYEDRKNGVYLFTAPVGTAANPAGYVVLLMEEESFYNTINVVDNEVSFVTDNFDNVLITSSRNFVNRYNKAALQMQVGEETRTVAGTNYYIAKADVPGFSLWVYTANAITQRLYRSLLIFVLAAILLFLALVWFLSGKISKNTSASVTQMIDAVRHTRNAELDYRVDIRTNDEFQELGEQFNKMQEQIETLLHNNEELVNLRRKAEVKQLEAQFNPHFIFNVLETLRYALYFDEDVAQQIITSLSRLLKYSIYSESKENTLTENLRYTEEYLRLHKFRLGNKMEFELDIPEETEVALVPKLVLQPIIENSIKYGYHNHNGLRVTLKARRQGEWLLLQVTDDGGGVTQQQYTEICSRLQQAELPPQHTGLYNINKRLKLMYGAQSGLTIINQEGEGFTVQVRLPFIRGM